MRLSRVKISGFKSFVDPCVLGLSEQLVGIVGPNGCGKSNIIDAVRWVMGESSAKTLRGGSMQDVIFTGSSQRKPIGQASVELVFDNREGKLGGQWSAYEQIAVRRTVQRDGGTHYALNGSRCRRRDITDIFLGTGLGPRSYAIIEQGMVARLITAKPEELRIYLEEAAGISRYKERRRDTQSRIAKTRENLARVDDLREEVQRQLSRLERQASVAERYRTLRQRERKISIELLLLQRRLLEKEQAASRAALTDADRLCAEQLLQLAQLSEQQTTLRTQIAAANLRVNQSQGAHYQAKADVAALHSARAHRQELAQKQQLAVQHSAEELQRLKAQDAQDAQCLEQLAPKIDDITRRLTPIYAELDDTQSRLQQAQQSHTQCHAEQAQFRLQWATFTQTIEAQQSRAQALDRVLVSAELRRSRLLSERAGLGSESELMAQLKQVQAQVSKTQEQIQRLEILRQHTRDHYIQAQARQRDAEDLATQKTGQCQRLEATCAALLALNEQEDRGQEALQLWLQQAGLDRAPRLSACIDTQDPDWMRAVEAALGQWLNARVVEVLPTQIETLPEGLRLVLDGEKVRGTYGLGKHVCAPASVQTLLSKMQVDLRGNQISEAYLAIADKRDAQEGVLARLRRLADTQATLQIAQGERTKSIEHRDFCAQQLHEAEIAREQTQASLNQALQKYSAQAASAQALDGELAQQQKARARTTTELAAVDALIGSESEAREEAQATALQAQKLQEQMAPQAQALEAMLEQGQAAVQQLTQQLSGLRQQAQQEALALQSLRSEQSAMQQQRQRTQAQIARQRAQQAHLQAQMGDSAEVEEIDEAARLLELDARVQSAHEALLRAQDTLRQLEDKQKTCDSDNQIMQQKTEVARAQVTQKRVQLEGVQTRLQALVGQIDACQEEVQAHQASLLPDASVEALSAELASIQTRLERMGAVNLAAIDELASVRERAQYLATQHADISQALTQLEQAIARIDKETKLRFQVVFDEVNTHFEQLFPRLFGGGSAQLALTDTDILNAGVSVLARPPGKRVSNIQLLSGGEKALTAVALVFAFFQLNPAPFCMLDEVDAPLDEANVGRFCALVAEMSKRVQFIFITHNRITMELASQLMGVTMNEPGVSRLVSVDISEASRLAGV